MKKLILTSATILFIAFANFAQDDIQNKRWYVNEYASDAGGPGKLYFEVRGNYSFPVTKEKLNDANSIRDFIPDYPVNWIEDYVSTEILAARNGKEINALNTNDVLNSGQKNILHTADLASTIEVNVRYKSKNPVTDNIGISTMHALLTVVPEIEATPEASASLSGNQQMRKYLMENVIHKIFDAVPEQFQHGVVLFTVNEEGEIVNVKISKTTGDSKTDRLLVDAISKMPKWKPAKSSKGLKVKEEFVFSVGTGGC
jgi:TonB family protein